MLKVNYMKTGNVAIFHRKFLLSNMKDEIFYRM